MEANEDWFESKREYNVNSDGKEILKKVTTEFKPKPKRDKLEIFLKLLPLLAITVTVTIFYIQRQNDRENQKSLYKVDVYSSTLANFQSLLNDKQSYKASQAIMDEISFKLLPKIKYINEKGVANAVANLVPAMSIYCKTNYYLDTVYNIILKASPIDVKNLKQKKDSSLLKTNELFYNLFNKRVFSFELSQINTKTAEKGIYICDLILDSMLFKSSHIFEDSGFQKQALFVLDQRERVYLETKILYKEMLTADLSKLSTMMFKNTYSH